jgi:hypothetical protein
MLSDSWSTPDIVYFLTIIFVNFYQNITISYGFSAQIHRLCGLVVRVLGYWSGGPGSIPGTTRKISSGSGTGSTQPREYNWGATWYKSSGSCLENGEYGRRDPSRWPRGTLYPQKLAIISLTSGSRSVGIVRLRTQPMELKFSAQISSSISCQFTWEP